MGLALQKADEIDIEGVDLIMNWTYPHPHLAPADEARPAPRRPI
jgi:hypothetical protein